MTDEKLISKKQLLERYGMSYSALYRWKRKGLIPEDWFIRKATPTGQETFFPEALIVRESIEADDVHLVHTVCPAVSGKRVVIGKGCKIDVVRYSESLAIDPDAEVGAQEKNLTAITFTFILVFSHQP